MSQSGGPGSGQPPSGPPDWQSAPQPPVDDAPPAAPGWQSQAQQPQAPASTSWQSAPKAPVPPAAPPPPPPSWTSNLTSTVPTPGPAGFVYADVPNRSIAMIIDVIAMAVVYFVIGIITLGIFGTSGDFVQRPSVMSLLVQSIISYAIWAAYFIYLWTAQRGTLGMKALGMQIGDEADGRALTVNQSAIRFAVLFGPQIVVGIITSFMPELGLVGLIGLAWLIYVLVSISQSPTKQGIHDKYARTMVVKSARRAG